MYEPLFIFLLLFQQDLVSKEIQDILLSVGSSPMFRNVCLLRLAWHIHELAASLKLVVKGRFNPIRIRVPHQLNQFIWGIGPSVRSRWLIISQVIFFKCLRTKKLELRSIKL